MADTSGGQTRTEGLQIWNGTNKNFDNLDLTTKGDLLVHDGSNYQRIGVGSDDQVLTADSGESNGVKWATSGGGVTGASIPTVQQAVGGSANASTTNSVSISAVSEGDEILVWVRGADDNDVSSISCTNTSFTNVIANNDASTGRKFAHYVGIVSGGSSGTTLTVNFGSSLTTTIVVMSVSQGLTPTAQSSDIAVRSNEGVLNANILSPTSARFFMAHIAYSTNSKATVSIGNPVFSFSEFGNSQGLIGSVGFAPIGSIGMTLMNSTSDANMSIVTIT